MADPGIVVGQGPSGGARGHPASDQPGVTGQAAAHDRAARALARLTPREQDVVVSVARGLTNTQIDATTSCSHILLELTNRTQIALLAHDVELL